MSCSLHAVGGLSIGVDALDESLALPVQADKEVLLVVVLVELYAGHEHEQQPNNPRGPQSELKQQQGH